MGARQPVCREWRRGAEREQLLDWPRQRRCQGHLSLVRRLKGDHCPYVGAYADYYFDNTGGMPLLLPTQFIQGWAGRVTAGLAYNINGGPKLSVGGELGGLGNDFLTWSVRGRASLPF